MKNRLWDIWIRNWLVLKTGLSDATFRATWQFYWFLPLSLRIVSVASNTTKNLKLGMCIQALLWEIILFSKKIDLKIFLKASVKQRWSVATKLFFCSNMPWYLDIWCRQLPGHSHSSNHFFKQKFVLRIQIFSYKSSILGIIQKW